MSIPAPTLPEKDERTYRFITHNTPDAARLTREHVAWLLDYNACPVAVDTAKLLVSEIVTNAHQHTDSRVVCLTTTIRPGGLRVGVYDTNPFPLSMPLDGPPSLLYTEHGRGLMLLQAFSSSWGYKLHGGDKPFGKTVYFVLLTKLEDPT
jgi:histidine kinase-like protein